MLVIGYKIKCVLRTNEVEKYSTSKVPAVFMLFNFSQMCRSDKCWSENPEKKWQSQGGLARQC